MATTTATSFTNFLLISPLIWKAGNANWMWEEKGEIAGAEHLGMTGPAAQPPADPPAHYFWRSSCSVLPREEAMACKWLTLRPAHHPDTLTQSVRYSQRDYQLQEGSPTIFWPKLCSILACWWVWRLVSSCGFTWGIRLWSSYQELGRERILPFLLYIYRGKLSLLLPSTFLGFLSQWMPSWRQA